MAILLGCGDGLHTFEGALRRVECPLESVSVLSCGGFAAVDRQARLLWDGRRLLDVEPGIETVLCWRGHTLTLSSETDSITLRDGQTGQPVTLAPAGVYPQHMCFSAQVDTVAACGGADGCIRLLALPSLNVLALWQVPGSASRIALHRGVLYALCTVENGDLRCLLCRLPLQGRRCDPLLTLPGLPGAISGDGRQGLWVAAGEMLYHVLPGAKGADAVYGGFGLISCLAPTEHGLLVCDPLMDLCCLLRRGARTVIRSGGVQCAGVW